MLMDKKSIVNAAADVAEDVQHSRSGQVILLEALRLKPCCVKYLKRYVCKRDNQRCRDYYHQIWLTRIWSYTHVCTTISALASETLRPGKDLR